jgi:aspartate/methionine/tyrosine aminotransferase
VRLNADVERAPRYPFLRLAEARRDAQANGAELVDLSMGEPTDPAPRTVREALARAAVEQPLCSYPVAGGARELRDAIAAWVKRRFDATVDPEREVLPTLGAKEPIALLARLFAQRDDLIAVGSPSYPIPERSARAAGLAVSVQTLTRERDWLPDPDAIPWERAAIVWVVNPHNPTGAVAPLALLDELARRCREHDAILAVDETYSEFWYGAQAPPSALQLQERDGIVVFNSLSKRSALAGLRSGFLAGDSAIVQRIRRHRSDTGTTPPMFIQLASVAAWDDDAHVSVVRRRFARKRSLLADAAARCDLRDAGGKAGVFLWLAVPDGDDMRAYELLLERALLVVPGSYLGAGGAGCLRVALTPLPDDVARAAETLRSLPRASLRGRARARSA